MDNYCQICNQVIKEEYYSVSTETGTSYWCQSCAKNDPEIDKHLRKMGKMSTWKQCIAEKIHNLLDNGSNDA